MHYKADGQGSPPRRYVFLLSRPRSGSTLLTFLLNNVSGCVALPETHFLVFHSIFRRLAFPRDQQLIVDRWANFYRTKKWIADLDALSAKLRAGANSWSSLFDLTVDHYLAEKGHVDTRVIVEKSPPHIFFQNEIIQLFPGSSALYLVRDPRAVAGSLLSMAWSTHNIYTIARGCKLAAEKIGQIQPNVVLRYEDLVSKDPSAASKMEQILDIQVEETRLYDLAADTRGMNTWTHRNLSQDMGTQFVDKWKDQLSLLDREVQVIEHICRSMMREYGYALCCDSKGSFVFRALMWLDIMKLCVTKLDDRIRATRQYTKIANFGD